MANAYLSNLEELRQIESRLDQRLELLAKAEGNLRGLFEALRQQVAGAYPVLEQLKEIVPQARQQVDEARLTTAADRIADSMAEQIFAAIEQGKSELQDLAGPIRQRLINDLQSATEAAKADVAVVKPQSVDHDAALETMAQMADSFRAEAAETLESVRQSMLDQIDLLKSDAKLQIDPILNQVEAVRLAAESQLCTAIESQQASMQYRVEQLSGGIDEVASILEQRLTQRISNINRRADDALAGIERTMDSAVTRLIDQAHASALRGEESMRARIEAVRPRLDAELTQADQHLTHRMERLEAHAASMCSYLEAKLTSHVDELIQRLRMKLQQELAATTGNTAPAARHEAAPSPIRPSLEVDLYVNRVQQPAAA
ncbi:MAG: hypothetical protein H7144_10435 [Burkholderiales bacterium]|nr:hypothetical protein [Phycisphaerae bacterium]